MSVADTELSKPIVIYAGEEAVPGRRADRAPIAHTETRIVCRTEEAARRLMTALRESNQRLIDREPTDPMFGRFDYRSGLWFPTPEREDAAGIIIMALAWYTEDYYHEGRAMWHNPVHQAIFDAAGVSLDDVQTTDWRCDPA